MDETIQSRATLQVGHCAHCGSHTFPATAPGCRVCGTAGLQAVPVPDRVTLRQAVTVHAELVPGLPVPCVIGEVELAPGVVEEARIDVASDSELEPGMSLTAVARTGADGRIDWRFVPASKAATE